MQRRAMEGSTNLKSVSTYLSRNETCANQDLFGMRFDSGSSTRRTCFRQTTVDRSDQNNKSNLDPCHLYFFFFFLVVGVGYTNSPMGAAAAVFRKGGTALTHPVGSSVEEDVHRGRFLRQRHKQEQKPLTVSNPNKTTSPLPHNHLRQERESVCVRVSERIPVAANERPIECAGQHQLIHLLRFCALVSSRQSLAPSVGILDWTLSSPLGGGGS